MRALTRPTSKLRLGLPRKPFFDDLNPEVGKAIDAALAVLAKLTAGMTRRDAPTTADGPTIFGVEAYTYHKQWITKTPELYDPPIRAALLRGADIKADAYARALRDLAQARRDIRKVFTNVDLLVLPTMADPPFKIEVRTHAQRQRPQHIALRHLWHPGDFDPLRVYQRGTSHRAPNRRSALGRADGSLARARL